MRARLFYCVCYPLAPSLPPPPPAPQTYAMFFTANAMDAVFDRFLENIEAGTLDESGALSPPP